MIKVKLHTILTLRQILGQREIEASIEDGSTIRDLLLWMKQQWGEQLSPHLFHPGSEQVLPHIRLLLNGRDIQFLDGEETVLRDGDELSILPMLTGG